MTMQPDHQREAVVALNAIACLMFAVVLVLMAIACILTIWFLPEWRLWLIGVAAFALVGTMAATILAGRV